MGLAGGGRGGRHRPSRGARVCRRRRQGSGRAGEAARVRPAQGQDEGERGPLRGAEAVREEPHRAVQVPALDRVRRRPAEDGDGQDPALQAQGSGARDPLGEDAVSPLDPKVATWKKAARDDPERFWAEAAEQLPWFKKWERVLEWEPPTFRWYGGGRSNLAYNCVDRHVGAGHGYRLALLTENERGQTLRFTYAQLLAESKRVSAALRGLGIEKGDRIAIYMPTSAEAIFLMLGAIRIGAVILVVFAGFGAGALGERVRLAGAKALFCTDVTYRKGKDVPLLPIVAQAVADAPTVA